jgi:hypothetical protein
MLGSIKAVKEWFSFIQPVLGHAVDLLKGNFLFNIFVSVFWSTFANSICAALLHHNFTAKINLYCLETPKSSTS